VKLGAPNIPPAALQPFRHGAFLGTVGVCCDNRGVRIDAQARQNGADGLRIVDALPVREFRARYTARQKYMLDVSANSTKPP
jgi:hypothetical protein